MKIFSKMRSWIGGLSPAAWAFAGFSLAVGAPLAWASYTSTYMSLTIPEVGDPGPTYASNVSDALDLIDSHDHSTGKGTKVPTGGITENADHEFNANDLTEVRTLRLDSGVITIAATDRRAVYASNGELFYIDASGNHVQITENGSVNAPAGVISGMDGTDAGVAYSDLTKTFSFTQDTGHPAKGDFSSVRIAENVVSGKGPVLTSNAATSADYNFIFPSALPGSTSLTVLEADGDFAAAPDGIVTFNYAASGMQVGYGLTTSGAFVSSATAFPIDATIPQNTEGDEVMTLAYTPKKIGNKIRVRASVLGAADSWVGATTASAWGAALFKDSTANAKSASAGSFTTEAAAGAPGYQVLTFDWSEIVVSTSSSTWKVRMGAPNPAGALSVDFNGSTSSSNPLFGATIPKSSIEIVEIAQ